MALTSWKAFPFFTATQVPVPADNDGAYIFDVGYQRYIYYSPTMANWHRLI